MSATKLQIIFQILSTKFRPFFRLLCQLLLLKGVSTCAFPQILRKSHRPQSLPAASCKAEYALPAIQTVKERILGGDAHIGPQRVDKRANCSLAAQPYAFPRGEAIAPVALKARNDNLAKSMCFSTIRGSGHRPPAIPQNQHFGPSVSILIFLELPRKGWKFSNTYVIMCLSIP